MNVKIPHINQPKAVILNFTADSYHWGCYATSMEIYHSLSEMGFYIDPISVSVTHSVKPTPAKLSDFTDQQFFINFINTNHWLISSLEAADIVIVNGEGTLHRLTEASLNLLYLIYVSKIAFEKPTFLINHSCFPFGDRKVPCETDTENIYKLIIEKLDHVVAREDYTNQIYNALEVSNTLAFDCLPRFLDRFDLTSSHDPQGFLLISGGIALSQINLDAISSICKKVIKSGNPVRFLMGAKSRNAPEDYKTFELLNAELPELEAIEAESMEEWINNIRFSNYLLSGRFHHTIAALALGTPCSTFPSNTPKIEGVMHTLNENKVIEAPLEEISERILDALEKPMTDVSDNRTKRMIDLSSMNFEAIHNHLDS
ncbi:MAG: polysaccharide pyruvyl transferase family protein [Gammaproteobacteria bacterium]|nr:polysaccharide pyruvyl transferase family protein [Gammaproteobacteria bacterium]